MALVDLHYAFVTFLDSRGKQSTAQFRVSSTDASAYYGALTQILKDATTVGQLLLSFEDLSAGVMLSKGVRLETIEDTASPPAPDDNIYHFDKLVVHYHAGIKNHWVSIPSRADANYTVAADGVTVILDDAAMVADFVSRFDAVVLPPYPETAAADVYLIEVSA